MNFIVFRVKTYVADAARQRETSIYKIILDKCRKNY